MVKDGQGWSKIFKDGPGSQDCPGSMFASSMFLAYFKHASRMLQVCFKLFQLPSPDKGLVYLGIILCLSKEARLNTKGSGEFEINYLAHLG